MNTFTIFRNFFEHFPVAACARNSFLLQISAPKIPCAAMSLKKMCLSLVKSTPFSVTLDLKDSGLCRFRRLSLPGGATDSRYLPIDKVGLK